jgi:predicted MFS family arabinose efflux permease
VTSNIGINILRERNLHPSEPFPPLSTLWNRVKVFIVPFLAIFLAILLVPFSMNLPSATACSAQDCCGANCSPGAPLSQVNCCKAPLTSDRAGSQAQDAHFFDSIAGAPLARMIVAVSHLQKSVVAHGYSPPDRLASLALLCSRQI